MAPCGRRSKSSKALTTRPANEDNAGPAASARSFTKSVVGTGAALTAFDRATTLPMRSKESSTVVSIGTSRAVMRFPRSPSVPGARIFTGTKATRSLVGASPRSSRRRWTAPPVTDIAKSVTVPPWRRAADLTWESDNSSRPNRRAWLIVPDSEVEGASRRLAS